MARLDQIHNLGDMRRLARRHLPRPIFDYIDGGADDETALANNADAFGRYQIVPDALVDVSTLRTETRLFGQPAAWPLMLAPTGLTRMFHPDGEAAVARAAAGHGLPYALSTMGTTRIEDWARDFTGPRVFQIYVFRDRGLTAEFVQRCKAAGVHGLALTVDTPVAGNRERDRRNGLSLPPRLTLSSLASFALHPGWSLPALRGNRFDLANVSHRVDVLAGRSMSLFDYIDSQFDRSVTWKDVEWLAAEWGGPLSIKGVMTPDDAARAVASGATGVMLSNHGGRQLDAAPAPVDQIAAVRDALGDKVEIICDGGVRRGSDVVKALALGADGCSVGRPYLYGLAAAGEAGVDRALTLLRDEFERTLMLMGVNDVAGLKRSHIRPASAPWRGGSRPAS